MTEQDITGEAIDRKPLKISFPWGMPGLDYNEFALSILAQDSPFYILSSTAQSAVRMLMINPFLTFNEYEFDLSDDIVEQLKIADQKQVAVFCTVNASRGIDSATINLMAPIVINTIQLIGKQIVLNDRKYSLRAPLAINRDVEESSENACAGA